jgi:serine phosphatase RsbU (regulator of sigma subunit)
MQRVRLQWSESRDSLRTRILVRVVLTMLSCFTVGNAIVLTVNTGRAISERQSSLRGRTLLLDSQIQSWESQIKTTLRALSLDPDIRTLDPKRANRILQSVYEGTQSRYWRFWRADGKLLSYTGSMPNIPLQELRILRDPGFQEALKGRFSFEISAVQQKASLASCLLASQPVYALPSRSERDVARVVGVLSFCLPMSRIGADSGLIFVTNNIRKEAGGTNVDVIEMHRGDKKGQAFFLLSREGKLVFPLNQGVSYSHLSLLSPRKVLASPWAPFVKMANQKLDQKIFSRIEVDGAVFYMLASRISDQWNSVQLIDEDTIYAPLKRNFLNLLLVQLATLLITTIALYLICDRVVRPIGKAGIAIKAISNGDFDVNLPGVYPGELGDLFHSINNTGGRLKELLAKALAHASTDQQIDTAKQIQRSFLIDHLPSDDHIDLAAFSEPAYEIGADWYDALKIDGLTYVVVADVCDKGIPSALFMGVFRSLIRYQISVADNRHDPAQVLSEVLTSVNNYMATTHSDAVMFATVFLACFDPATNLLTYVSAGHEATLLMHSKGITRLEEGGGGAIGIFPGAQYHAGSCNLVPQDVLVLYTDGVSDARSPTDTSFSLDGLEACLQELPPQLSASAIADHIRSSVRSHIASASQFDDMTVMVLRLL